MNEIELSDSDGIIVEKIDRLTTSVGFYHEDRIAEVHVLIYVISGSIYVTEEGVKHVVNPGELLFLKKGTHQYGEQLVEAGTSWIYAHFSINKADVSLQNNDEYITEGFNNHIILLPKYMEGLETTDIPARLHTLVKLSQTSKEMVKSRVSLGLHSLLLDIYEQNMTSSDERLSDKIVRYLQDHIHEDLSSEDLEKHFHLTYKYLVRVFKLDVGMGIMKYHDMQRIYAASRELRSTSKPINEISLQFGFSDPLYFSKCFRKQMNVSPREYRKIQSIF